MAQTRRNRGKQSRRRPKVASSAGAARSKPAATLTSLPPALSLAGMLSLAEETDETGRLLLEDSAPERARELAEKAGIPMVAETCPYRDTPSRLGGQMNSSAYEALRHDTAEMLNGFAWIARHYLQGGGYRPQSVRGLFDVTHLGLTLPLILFRRGREPFRPEGELPSYVASIFKASRGVFSASLDMLNKRGTSADPLTVAQVVEFADREKHLARPKTDRVCAAPTRLIERTIGVILTGEGGDAEQSRLGELVEFTTLWDFYRLQDGFNEAFSTYRFHLNSIMEGDGGADPVQLFGRMVVDGGVRRSLGDLTESLLRQANAAQGGLNRLLDRSERATPVSFPDLFRML